MKGRTQLMTQSAYFSTFGCMFCMKAVKKLADMATACVQLIISEPEKVRQKLAALNMQLVNTVRNTPM